MSWNPFRRARRAPFDLRPRPIPPQPEAERDWAPGDRAECIAPVDGTWTQFPCGVPVNGPKRGQIARVLEVAVYGSDIYLILEGWQHMGCYSAGHFRKLRPCSTDFREQLRQRAPADGRQPQRVAPPAIKEPELVP